MIRVLLIDHHDSFTYNLAALLRSLQDVNLKIIFPEDAKREEIKFYDKIVFSPGPGLPAEYPLMHKILDAHKHDKSILGVCLGHQSIAEYFGAGLINLDDVQHGRVKQLYILEPDSRIYRGVPDKTEVGLYHSWYVDTHNLPESLNITALSNDGIIMSLEHKVYDIQSVQFHPESFITKQGKKIMANWVNR